MMDVREERPIAREPGVPGENVCAESEGDEVVQPTPFGLTGREEAERTHRSFIMISSGVSPGMSGGIDFSGGS